MKKADTNTDMIKNVLLWTLLFFGFFSLINSFSNKENTQPVDNITIKPISSSYTIGNLVEFKFNNNSNKNITIASTCSDTEIFRIANDKRISVSNTTVCNNQSKTLDITAQDSKKFGLPLQNATSFSEAGEYFVVVTDSNGVQYESIKLTIEKPGFFTKMFRTLIMQPMFNALVFLTQILPGKNFGISIVLLTLLVRLLLFPANQKAMRSQRALQKLQPKLDTLKTKFKGNQQMIAMKTMELYKTHKVNPMSSCLPMLIQIPVMLGVYYSVKDGLAPYLSHLLYPFQSTVELSAVDTQFLIWDLANIPWNTFIASISVGTAIYLLFPLLVAAAQYIAISLTMNNKKKQPVSKKKKTDKEKGMTEQMEAMTGMMKYAMPVMIGFFAATFPAALGLYWLTSTIFGIFQQKMVNKQIDEKPEIRKKIS